MNLGNDNITLRQDLYQDKKCIHVKLDKDTHSAIRTLSFHKGISMQEMFEEFARSLTAGDKRAVGIIDKFILKKLNLPKRLNRYRKKKATELSDPDKQSLYDLIDDREDELDGEI